MTLHTSESIPPCRSGLATQVSAVTKKTGFAEGLYEGEELESGAIKDKEAKLNYLRKIIDCISICLGEALDVRGAKVLAPCLLIRRVCSLLFLAIFLGSCRSGT